LVFKNLWHPAGTGSGYFSLLTSRPFAVHPDQPEFL
jgi:hypothetical protein